MADDMLLKHFGILLLKQLRQFTDKADSQRNYI